MNTINIKALSVNRAWQGKRFKTPAYKSYERIVHSMLPRITIPDGYLALTLEFGFSSKLADFDNGIKPFIDILQKKYGFNDNKIKSAVITVNNDVKNGDEYISFSLTGRSSK